MYAERLLRQRITGNKNVLFKDVSEIFLKALRFKLSSFNNKICISLNIYTVISYHEGFRQCANNFKNELYL